MSKDDIKHYIRQELMKGITLAKNELIKLEKEISKIDDDRMINSLCSINIYIRRICLNMLYMEEDIWDKKCYYFDEEQG